MPMCIWDGLDGLQELLTQITNYQKHLRIQMECGLTGGLWQIALQESLTRRRLTTYQSASSFAGQISISAKITHIRLGFWFQHLHVITSTLSNSTLFKYI
jgi:hypothetical protein